MGIFSAKPSENAQKIIDFLGCPCKYFPAGKPASLIYSEYEEAFARRQMGGYTPVVIVVDDLLAEYIDIIKESMKEGETPEQFRQRLISTAVPNAREWFTETLSELKESSGEYWQEITAENGETGTGINEFSGYLDFPHKKTKEVILAKIPTENPWEIFAWIPFGGWNACPDSDVMITVARHWYEKFKAVPAVISHDTLEFFGYPVKDRGASVGLALEHYAFCCDVIDQGVGSIAVLADILSKSTVWYFWWD